MEKIKTLLNSHPKHFGQVMGKLLLVTAYLCALSWGIDQGVRHGWGVIDEQMRGKNESR